MSTKTKTKNGRRSSTALPGLLAALKTKQMSIGIFNVVKMPGDKVWLQVTAGPNAGEGMQCDELALEAVISKFFAKNF